MKSLILSILVLFSSTVFCQSSNAPLYSAWSEEFISKEKICIVLTPLDELNSIVKKSFTENWQLHSNIEYLTFEETLKLEDEEKVKRAFVFIYPEETAVTWRVGQLVNTNFYEIIYTDYSEKSVELYDKYFTKLDKFKNDYFTFKFVYRMNQFDKKGEELISRINCFPKNLNNLIPTDAKLKIITTSTQQYINFCKNNKSGAIKAYVQSSNNVIKEKTLYVLKDLIGKTITEEEFKAIYPFKVKFVDKETYDEAILNNQKDIAILSIEPMMQMFKYALTNVTMNAVFGQYIYSTEDMKMIGGQIPLVTPYKYSSNKKITKVRVKKYTKW